MRRLEKVELSDDMLVAGGTDAEALEKFMSEYFPFNKLCKVGFFKKEWKYDEKSYYITAKRVCEFFGYKTVFEYRKELKSCISSEQARFHMVAIWKAFQRNFNSTDSAK